MSSQALITFDASLECSVHPVGSYYDIEGAVIIQGRGADKDIISKTADGPLFLLYGPALELDNVGIASNATWTDMDSHWAGLVNGMGSNAALNLDGVSVSGLRNTLFTSEQMVYDGTDSNKVNIDNSLFSGNESIGWGMIAAGEVNVTNTTFADNVFWEGAVISVSWFGTGTVVHTTILQNEIHDALFQGDLGVVGSLIGTESVDPLRCFNMTERADLGGNLWLNTSTNCGADSLPAATAGMGVSGLTTAEAVKVLDLALHNTDPTNAGSTFNFALDARSIARDYFTAAQLTEEGASLLSSRDQRGVTRPAGTAYDVGSYEASPVVSCKPGAVGTIYFKPYSSALVKTSKAKLDKYAAKIASSKCAVVNLVGHTATVDGQSGKTAKYRKALSLARAKQVQRYLAKKLGDLGVTVTFKVSAVAAKDPAASNGTDAGRAANRRVVIALPEPVL